MALRNKNLEMTDSGSGSTTKADDQKKPKTLSVQQTSANTTAPAQATASTAAQTTTEPEKVRYNSANYRYEATDTGGGYEKNQIVWRHPDLPIRTVIDVYRDTTPGVLLTQEEKNQRMEEHAQWEAEQHARIAASEAYLKQLELARLGTSGRFYGQNLMYGGENSHAKIMKMEREGKVKLRQLKDELYYFGMQQDQAFAEDLYLRGGGTLWDAIQQEQTVNDQIAQNRQALAALPVGDPRRQALEQEIQQDLAWVNYVKQVAAENGIDYNDLVEYAQRVEDEAKMQENVQFWTDYTQKDDRSMNAANWASVPMKALGEITGTVAGGVQAVKNALSGQYRPVNTNTIWHYGTNVSNAIRETSGEEIYQRLGGDTAGRVARQMYEGTMGIADAAFEWIGDTILPVSALLPEKLQKVWEIAETAAELVENSVELEETFSDAIAEGASGAEAFALCMMQMGTDWIADNLIETLENDPFRDGFENPYTPTAEKYQTENAGLMQYDPDPSGAFLTGFDADAALDITKRTAAVTGQGKISKPVFENVVWQEVRHPAYEKNKYVLERDSQANKVYWKMGQSVYNDVQQRKFVRNRR